MERSSLLIDYTEKTDLFGGRGGCIFFKKVNYSQAADVISTVTNSFDYNGEIILLHVNPGVNPITLSSFP